MRKAFLTALTLLALFQYTQHTNAWNGGTQQLKKAAKHIKKDN